MILIVYAIIERMTRDSWKYFGNFGVKHCGVFNLALLSKWLSKILEGPNSIWVDLLRFSYGDIKRKILVILVPPLLRRTQFGRRI